MSFDPKMRQASVLPTALDNNRKRDEAEAMGGRHTRDGPISATTCPLFCLKTLPLLSSSESQARPRGDIDKNKVMRKEMAVNLLIGVPAMAPLNGITMYIHSARGNGSGNESQNTKIAILNDEESVWEGLTEG
ncbi:hypothetical protein ARMGADRAFT_1039814 [Armillaria gallica]|uniref:Uncharacterized protein n=1 Tax=Armillaria gallica TaxID=47427 RepID=A0A2H3CCG8_ARMGA|nr:hypothetical protein ARMGADRAFT_1039814 [Armillaria gallica]